MPWSGALLPRLARRLRVSLAPVVAAAGVMSVRAPSPPLVPSARRRSAALAGRGPTSDFQRPCPGVLGILSSWLSVPRAMRSSESAKSAALLVAALAGGHLAGCESATIATAWPELEPDELLFLRYSRGDESLAIEGPLQPGYVSRGLLHDDVRLTAVIVPVSDLRERLPDVAYARAESFALEPTRAGCAGVHYDDARRSVPLDASTARTYRWDDAWVASGAAPGLSLTYEVELDACFGRRLAVGPFGADERLWSPGDAVGEAPASKRTRTLAGGDQVSEGRWMLYSSSMVVVADAGEAWANDPRRWWSVDTWPLPSEARLWTIQHAIRDPRLGESEEARFLVTLSALADDAGETVVGSSVLELRWNTDGFLPPTELVRTGVRLNRTRTLLDGRWFSVGDEGTAVLDGEVLTVPNAGAGRLRDWALNETLGEAHVAIVRSDQHLLFGDIDAPTRFRLEPSVLIRGGAYDLVSVRGTAGTSLITPTNQGDVLIRPPLGPREVLSIVVPSALRSCLPPPDACGRNTKLGTNFISVAPTGQGGFVITGADCRGAIEVQLETGCSRAIVAPGGTAAIAAGGVVRALSTSADAVLVMGLEGFLIEGRWSSP